MIGVNSVKFVKITKLPPVPAQEEKKSTSGHRKELRSLSLFFHQSTYLHKLSPEKKKTFFTKNFDLFIVRLDNN